MPTASALRSGNAVEVLAGTVARFGTHSWTPRRHVDAVRPVHLRERLSAQQLAGRAIEDVEESVLVRLHDDVPRAAVETQVGDRQRARRVDRKSTRLNSSPLGISYA